MKRRVGFDIDGVLYNWHYALYNEYLIYGKTDKTMEEFWNIQIPNLNSIENNYIVSLEHLYMQEVPTKIQMNFIWELSKEFEIFYITSRKSDLQFVTEKYLRINDYPYKENLIMTKDKASIIQRLNLEVFLEDQLNQAEAIAKFCPVLLVTQYWNEDRELPDNVFRIQNIYELRSFI